ncbi:MAG: RDD family protein [Bdellovibrionaceae bacterium]|nr:RDD family protein [Bdellovibrionales bacterium]MCB9253450.1 RDD family protein [Pseudobdellovibrionaceae bacterium]
MGKYVPFQKGRPRSLQDALDEAEEDHFVDCPEAPYLLRAAAAILDTIFLTIGLTSFNRVATALFVYFGTSDGTVPVLFSSFVIASDVTLVYVYCLWTVHRFGGSPAKLLFNLRVVDTETGKRLELYQIFLRETVGKALSLALLGFGFFLPLIRHDQRALHDLICSSSVKKIDEGVK